MYLTRRMFKMSWRRAASSLFLIGAVVAVGFVYICGKGQCGGPHVIADIHQAVIQPLSDSLSAYKDGRLPYYHFGNSAIPETHHVNINKEDVIVFLHMQKTGGTTFGRHLVRNLELKSPCKCYKKKKRCDCYTNKKTIWLFSRYSTGWICGLHADWTELNSCVDSAMNKKEGKRRQRKYHYITILRDPVKRFLSEWKHITRGATWKDSKLFCNGHSATREEVPLCYNGSDWSDASLNDFLNCQSNLARNRQTRMLANLTLVNCYNTSGMDPVTRDEILLKSAKENLLKMAYFGLTEFQMYSQKLFEYNFDLKFINEFAQLPVTHSDRTTFTEEQKEQILSQNKLDIDLYQYAKDLFLQRIRNMKKQFNDDSIVEDYLMENKDQFDDSVDIKEDDDDDDY